VSADPLAWVGIVAAAGAAGVALVTDGRPRAVAMLAALTLAPIVIAGDVWDTERIVDLRDSPARLVLGGVLALGLVGALVAVLRRWPAALALLAFAALPFRIPISLGGEDANLLIPLYAVIAAGAVTVAIEAWLGARVEERLQRDDGRGATADPSSWRGTAVTWLPRLLAAFLVLYAIQSAYSDDFSKAVENVGFFFVPFAVLLVLLGGIRWTPGLLAGVLGVVVGEALLFAVVGFGEFAVGEVFWNPEVIAANEVHTYFRVNSLFWDPNVLGRYLVLAILGAAAYMVWSADRRGVWLAGAMSGVLLVAVGLTFSQSSLVALLGGLLVLTALRWGARWAAAGIGLAAVAGVGLVLLSGADVGSERSLDIRSSGRAGLVRGGIDLAADRPIWGYGSGSFQTEFQVRFPDEAEGTGSVSHTEPVTVAAEQGVIGLVQYLALVAAGFGALLAVPAGLPIARSALLACLTAMVVHSLAYAGLLIDPVTWALLGLGLALARGAVAAEAPATARERGVPRVQPATAS
jgi:putative inorganic carbon (hco3(-)) transporter